MAGKSGKAIKGARGAAAAAMPADNEAKLLELFENRNALKRELEQVRSERDALRAEVKELRARYDELQRQLASLEQMLADPGKGHNAIVYYRLRAVWETCRQQLRALAEELSSRYEKNQRTAFDADFERERNARLQELSQRFEKLEREHRTLRDDLNELQQQAAKLGKLWQRGQRAGLQRRMDALLAQIKPLETQKLEVLAETEKLRKTKLPPWPGIDLPARRAVNLSLLALAQYLYLHFTEHNIAEMARSAGTKPVADVNFGMLEDYQSIHSHIYEVVAKLRGDKARPDKLRFRAEYLRRTATYVSDKDTVPEESCLDYISPASQSAPTIDADASPVAVNVLRLNYWDIQSVLLRPPEESAEAPPLKSVGLID